VGQRGRPRADSIGPEIRRERAAQRQQHALVTQATNGKGQYPSRRPGANAPGAKMFSSNMSECSDDVGGGSNGGEGNSNNSSGSGPGNKGKGKGKGKKKARGGIGALVERREEEEDDVEEDYGDIFVKKPNNFGGGEEEEEDEGTTDRDKFSELSLDDDSYTDDDMGEEGGGDEDLDEGGRRIPNNSNSSNDDDRVKEVYSKSPKQLSFGYKPPPSNIPTLKLSVLRSPRGEEGSVCAPDPQKAVYTLSDGDKAFSPRSYTSCDDSASECSSRVG